MEWERNGFRPQINGKVYTGWTRNEIDIYLPNMVHPDQIATIGLNEPKAETIIGCGGCGNANPTNRCFGCMHDFGDDTSAWVREK